MIKTALDWLIVVFDIFAWDWYAGRVQACRPACRPGCSDRVACTGLIKPAGREGLARAVRGGKGAELVWRCACASCKEMPCALHTPASRDAALEQPRNCLYKRLESSFILQDHCSRVPISKQLCCQRFCVADPSGASRDQYRMPVPLAACSI